MNRINFKGIILAALFVLILDTISGIVMIVFMGGGSLQEGMTAEQMSDAIAAVTLGTNFLFGSLVLGSLSTIAGGYVAARIAKKEFYLNAGAIGVLGIIFGVLLASNYPFWFNVLGFLSALPAALLGGHLARSRNVANA